jgi:drug/metabolite transporter (DMT)-like permease
MWGMLGVALAAGSSLSWGLADFSGGLLSRRLPVLTVLLGNQAVGAVLLVAVVAVRGHGPPPGHELVLAALSGVSGIVALTAFYRALAIGTMSIVAPITATSAVVPVAVGMAGGERPGGLRLVGMGLALAGVILASRQGTDDPNGAWRGRTADDRLSVLLAVLAALAFGGFFVGMARAAATDFWWAVLVSRAVAILLLVAAVTASGRRLGAPLAALAPISLVGVLDVGGVTLYAAATTTGLLSVVSVLGSLYPAVTVVMARRVLGERIGWVQRVGVVATLLGVALIAAG